MLIAGEASGDTLGAELVTALRDVMRSREDVSTADFQPLNNLEPKFFGVGGPQMQCAGVELIYDFTRDAVFGLEAITRLFEFRARFKHLLHTAKERAPDAIVCVDFAGFNRRFAHAVKSCVREQRGPLSDWDPKIIQYVSPQVWASRPRRADKLAKDVDLLLTIFPFEKAWYAKRTPDLRVEFIGHPMIDRYAQKLPRTEKPFDGEAPAIVLLPGSRPTELKRHLPIMAEALRLIREVKPKARAVMVLSDRLAEMARQIGLPREIEVQSSLAEALAKADLAIAKSGTVTLECAYFGVPTVAMYKTSPATYAIAKRIVKVKWIAMPNILANEEVFPEFVQSQATPQSIARAALELLEDQRRRNNVKGKLRQIAASLGEPGASRRAAKEIIGLLQPHREVSSRQRSNEG